jgi:hypothetical protein
MPLSLGVTPSQVSLFRHIADPKQVSLDKIRQVKFKTAKEKQSSFSAALKSRAGGQTSKASVQPYKASTHSRHYQSGQREHVGRRESYEREYNHDSEEEEDDGQDDRQDDNERNNEHNSDQDNRHNFQEDSIILPRSNERQLGEDMTQVNDSRPGQSSYETEKSQVASQINEEVDREKEHFLAELRKYRGQTAREFTMQDSLTDIQFEYDRLKSPENAANVVRIMGIVLQVIVYAVQWGNNKVGPLLKLDNGETSWAMQMGESISNHEYDNVLEKLYRKHWRKGSMSPEAELGMMIVGSAGVFHFQTHVNEKLQKTKSSDGSKSKSGGGFNLMDLVGPVLGLATGGGGGGFSKPSPLPTTRNEPPAPSPPSKRFDFIAGKTQSFSDNNQDLPPRGPIGSPPPRGPLGNPFGQAGSGSSSGNPSGNPSGSPLGGSSSQYTVEPSRAIIDLEQQFAKRQQEMMDRLDQVTRRADEQMRASQARQLDLERQLQQTQMKLHQVQQQPFQQQLRPQQFQQLRPVHSVHSMQHTVAAQQQAQQGLQQALQQPQIQQQALQQQALQQPQIQQQALQQPQARQGNRVLPTPQKKTAVLETVNEVASDVEVVGSHDNASGNESNGEMDTNQLSDNEEEEQKVDVKEVMVTERGKRSRNTPVELEIDELSISL